MSQLPRRSVYYKLAMVLILAASCARIFICFVHNPMDYLWSDMLRHWNNGRAFPRGGYLGASDPIVYQAYVFVLQKISAGNRFLVAFASSLLSVLMPWTFYRAARNFGLQKSPALWVWVLIAWAPSLVVIYHFIMMETVLLLLEGMALWMTGRYLRKGGTAAFLDLVFFWTLACLTKPTVIPLAGICVLWVWWKKSTPLRPIALGAALALVLLLPQAVRTRIALGFVAPFGNPWFTRIQLRSGVRLIHLHFYAPDSGLVHLNPQARQLDFDFGSPSAFLRPLEPLSHWVMRRAIGDSSASITINGANGEKDWKAAYYSFDRSWDAWLGQWRENIILFLFAPSWPEVGANQWDGYIEYQVRWIWAPLILFLLVVNVRQFVRGGFDLIPVATTLFTLILGLQNAVITEARYRKPVEPLLLMNLVWILSNRGSETQSAKVEPAARRSDVTEAAV